MGIVYVTDETDMTLVHRDMCAGDLRCPGVEPICREANEINGKIELSLWPLGFRDHRGNVMWIERGMLHSWGQNNPSIILASLRTYADVNIVDTF